MSTALILTLSRTLRRVSAGAALASLAVVSVDCVGAFDLEGYTDATGDLCAQLAECFGDEYVASCEDVTGPLLASAPADKREQWLADFGANNCTENCVNARSCLDLDPLCTDIGTACSQSESCCGFTVGLAECKDGACCVKESNSCTSDDDCCGNVTCDNGVCGGGVECSPAGAPCLDNFTCCTEVCDVETGMCAEVTCLPDGGECDSAGDCCSFNCVPQDGGGAACEPPICSTNNQQCAEPSECCGGYCVPVTKDGGMTYYTVCSDGDCIPEGGYCDAGEDCCSKYCDPTEGKCATPPQCSVPGDPCVANDQCCNGACSDAGNGTGAECVCRPDGASCGEPADCCSGSCAGVCQPSDGDIPQCVEAGTACNADAADAPCCSGSCIAGYCCQETACGDGCDAIVDAPLSPTCATHPGVSDEVAGGCVEEVCNQPGYEHCCCTDWSQQCAEAFAAACSVTCSVAGQ